MVRGSHVITFNGEIYNYIEVGAKLKSEGVKLETASDTEVLLKAYQHWGEAALKELNGMFAFAIYDSSKHELFCARDRFGEKPFLFHSTNDLFAFSSEYKALLALENISSSYDQQRLIRFLYHPTHGLDNEIQTIFHDIQQIPPSHSLTLNTQTLKYELKRYWDIYPNNTYALMKEEDAQTYFLELLRDSIKLRLRSDVSLGSCLSGGLDSSAIVAIAKEFLGKDTPYNVFTGCFPDTESDEWQWAEKIIVQTAMMILVTLTH